MRPLDYKNIGGEEHLSFDSIRRLVLRQLSELSEREAKKHIDQCPRCQGIHQSLAEPEAIRESNVHHVVIKPLVLGLVLVLVLIGAAASILYFGNESKPSEEKVADVAKPAETDTEDESEIAQIEEVAPIIEAIDTLAQISEEPEVESPLPTNKQFDEYIEKQQSEPRVRLWGIYGKITAGGQPLPGVTVQIPGSRTSRVTDEDGKYYIQVPRNTKSLLFIYQGKQLIKDLDPDSRRLDIHLKSESLSYPESKDQVIPKNIDS